MLERADRPASTAPPTATLLRQAAISPLTVVLTAAGVGLSLVGGTGVATAVGVGLLAWALGVTLSTWLARRRQRRRQRPEPIDPYRVPDPWRRFVREALGAQTRFAQAADQCRPGPLRDRLTEAGGRIDDAVRECWRVARLGATLDAALANLDLERTRSELRAVQDERRDLLAGGSAVSTEASDQTEAALAARLQSGRRIEAAARRATDRLQLVTAQLTEAVASAAEVSLGTTSPESADSLAANIDSVVAEIEALRRALEETAAAPTPGASPPS